MRSIISTRQGAAAAPSGSTFIIAATLIANGLIEGINSLVQAAKAKARGYRSIRNLKAIIDVITFV